MDKEKQDRLDFIVTATGFGQTAVRRIKAHSRTEAINKIKQQCGIAVSAKKVKRP